MTFFTALLTGFISALFGLLAPSLLNMTAAKMSIERGKTFGLKFAVGASSFVFIQAGIAVFFAKFLVVNSYIINRLKIISIFILLGLAIFFFVERKKQTDLKKRKEKKSNPFLIGFGMSSLNMLGVPFYLAMTTIAERNKWIQLIMPDSLFFVIGAVLGDFLIFSLYAIFAIELTNRIKFITKNFNYILSGGLVILALITFIDIVS